MRDFLDRLKDDHKHTTVAQVAVMRKLLIIVIPYIEWAMLIRVY